MTLPAVSLHIPIPCLLHDRECLQAKICLPKTQEYCEGIVSTQIDGTAPPSQIVKLEMEMETPRIPSFMQLYLTPRKLAA